MDPGLLRRTAEIAAEYLTSLPERPVRAAASLDDLRSALRVDLDDRSRPALEVIEELVAAADPGRRGAESPVLRLCDRRRSRRGGRRRLADVCLGPERGRLSGWPFGRGGGGGRLRMASGHSRLCPVTQGWG
jgi:hypothetical protein